MSLHVFVACGRCPFVYLNALARFNRARAFFFLNQPPKAT